MQTILLHEKCTVSIGSYNHKMTTTITLLKNEKTNKNDKSDKIAFSNDLSHYRVSQMQSLFIFTKLIS